MSNIIFKRLMVERFQILNVVSVNKELFRLVVQGVEILCWPVKAKLAIVVGEDIHRFRNNR